MARKTRTTLPTVLSTVATFMVGTWIGCSGADPLTKSDQIPKEDLSAGNDDGQILPNDPAGGGTVDQPAGGGTVSGTGDGAGSNPGGSTDPTGQPISAVVCLDAAGAEVAGAVCGADNICRDAAGNIIEGTCTEVTVPECPASTSLSTSASASAEDGTMDPADVAAAVADGMSISNSTSTSTSASCSLSTSTSTSASTDTDADDGL